MKKILSCIITLLMLTSALAGCGKEGTNVQNETKIQETEQAAPESEEIIDVSSVENTEETVEITYANFNASGGNEEVLNAMYAKFQEKYPNIKVNIETIGYDDYFTQMQTRVAGGTAPDCYELNIENFAAYANKGVLAEITGIETVGYNSTALSAFQVDGKQYGVPGNFSNVVLIYNKDLFDQAGAEYPTESWTWDDVMEVCDKISALGEDIYGIYQPITFNEFFKVARQYDGGVLNEEKSEFTIDSPENIEAATMMVEKITKTNVQPNEAQMGGMGDWDLFESGRLGMILTGIWAFNTFSEACDFNWDISVEPGKTQKATHFFSNALVINNDSDKKEAAATWINWLASGDEAAKMRIEAGWDLPAISNDEILSGYLKLTPPENRKAVFDSLKYLVVAPIIEDYSLMSDIVTDKLTLAANGEVTAEEALKQAQEECSTKISLE